MTEPKRWTIFKRRGEWDDVIVGPDVGSPGVGEPVVPLADFDRLRDERDRLREQNHEAASKRDRDWKLVRSLVRDVRALEDDALAAVAAERERLGERLLSDEAVRAVAMTYEPDTFRREPDQWHEDALSDARDVLSAAWRVVTGSNA